MAVAGIPARRFWEEVNTKTMRKLLALSTVALLALTLAIAAFGCAKKAEEPAATEAPATTDSTMTEAAPVDTAAAMDTTAAH